MKAQGATEYLVLMSVVLGITLICITLLVWPTGTAKDAKQSQSDIKYGINKIGYPELASGLMMYYKFDEGIGTTAYNAAAPNANDAFFNALSWAAGKSGKAGVFDGTDYAQISYQLTKPFTFSAWFKSNTVSGNHQLFSAGSNMQFYLSGSTLRTAGSIMSYSPISAGTWYHAVLVADTSSSRIYINNVLVASNSTTFTPASSFYIGAYNPSNELWNGTLEDVRFYNRALSDAEVELLYKNPGYP